MNILRFPLEVHKRDTFFFFLRAHQHTCSGPWNILRGNSYEKIQNQYSWCLSLFALGCENSDVAGLTISYQGYVYSLSNQRRSVCLIKLIIMFQNKIIKSLRIIPMKRNYCLIVEEWTMLITWKLLLSPKSVISFESESGSKYLKIPNPHLSLGKQSEGRKYRPWILLLYS